MCSVWSKRPKWVGFYHSIGEYLDELGLCVSPNAEELVDVAMEI